jgi:hypothetical protein
MIGFSLSHSRTSHTVCSDWQAVAVAVAAAAAALLLAIPPLPPLSN